MSAPPIDPREAEVLVEARLGRLPQDMLEAAVVLEAWAGVPAQGALATGRAMMPALPRDPEPSAGRLPEPRRPDGVLVEGTASIVTVIAIAAWAAPLTSSFGRQIVTHALMIALPLTFALQWALLSRYLDRPRGVEQLARHRSSLLVSALVLVALASVALGLTGAVAGLLTVTWSFGTILIRRRWALVYVLIIVLATPAMIAGVATLEALAVIAAATALAVAFALRAPDVPARRTPGHWERAVAAAAIGAGLGLMLVLDGTVSWTAGAVPALALLPSTVAAFWGAYHLRRLDRAMPRALSGIRVAQARPRGRASLPLGVLAGTLGRVVMLTATLSAVLVWLTPWLGSSTRGAGVLIGFGLMALTTLLVGLLESMGRGAWALFAVGCAAGVELVVRVHGSEPFAGVGLVAGGAIALFLVLPEVVALLSRPASTLATALWIR
jgi:hypothetical protein